MREKDKAWNPITRRKPRPRQFGLKAVDLAPDVRIVLTADVFDALTAECPYRAAISIGKPPAILREGAGTSHDPPASPPWSVASKRQTWHRHEASGAL